MAIILDADVIIRGERGSFDLSRWFAANVDEEFEVVAITVAELWHGVERATAAHRTKRERYLTALLGGLPVIPYTALTALRHARLWASLEQSGKMIGSYDLILAATALERGSTIATFNERHFSPIRGLRIVVPK